MEQSRHVHPPSAPCSRVPARQKSSSVSSLWIHAEFLQHSFTLDERPLELLRLLLRLLLVRGQDEQSRQIKLPVTGSVSIVPVTQ